MGPPAYFKSSLVPQSPQCVDMGRKLFLGSSCFIGKVTKVLNKKDICPCRQQVNCTSKTHSPFFLLYDLFKEVVYLPKNIWFTDCLPARGGPVTSFWPMWYRSGPCDVGRNPWEGQLFLTKKPSLDRWRHPSAPYSFVISSSSCQSVDIRCGVH